MSRAVANMAVLAEYCLPFVKPGGYFIPYKTETIEEEIRQGEKAIEILDAIARRNVFCTLEAEPISAFELAHIALEKQIPKIPDYEGDGYADE